MAASAVTRYAQGALSWAYRGVRRTGILDTAAGRRAFEGAYWAYKSLIEASELTSLKPYASPESTVIDVGANIGFFTVRFALWVGPAGHVFAIEPEAVNAESLRARVKRLGLDDRTSIVCAAALEAPGTTFLELNPDNPADHRVAQAGVPVEAVSIDSLMQQGSSPRVSLIKVDVQGAELRVLRGARSTIARDQPALFVELHEPSLSASGTSAGELLGELRGMGYSPRLWDGAWRLADDEAIFEAMRRRGYVDALLLADRPL